VFCETTLEPPALKYYYKQLFVKYEASAYFVSLNISLIISYFNFGSVLKMESRFANTVRKLSEPRTKLMEWSRDKVPHPIFESNLLFHPFLVCTYVLIMVAIFGQERALDLFSFHPIFMSLGTLIFIAEAVIAHKNHLLAEILGPIMQHTRKQKIRAIHQNLNMIGASFLGLGFLFMLANKLRYGKSIFPQTWHALMGWFSLGLLTLQGVIGSQKMHFADNKNMFNKMYKWHGDSGLLLWDSLCLSIILGMLEYFGLSFFHLTVEAFVLACWWMVHLQLKRKGTDGDSQAGETGEEESEPMLIPDDDDVSVSGGSSPVRMVV
jgi:hypothetical protein